MRSQKVKKPAAPGLGVLLETAREQIRRDDPDWAKTLLEAWAAAMPGIAEADRRAELLDVLAEGRERQGFQEEAAKCRKTAAALRDTEARLQALEKKLGLCGKRQGGELLKAPPVFLGSEVTSDDP